MAAPHHQRPSGTEAIHHASRLRVVQQDDVPDRNPGGHLLDVGFQGIGHHGALCLTQLSAVTRLAVQHVVHALGDPEELRVTGEDEPAGVYVHAAYVSQQGLQHLGDPPALCGGIDVPDHAITHQRTRLGCHAREPDDAIGWEKVTEPIHLQ